MEHTLQNRRYPIQIQGKIYSVEDQINNDYSPLFNSVVDGQDYLEASCLCSYKEAYSVPPTIIIKRRIGRTGHDVFRKPGTGPKHAIHCIYYAPSNRFSGLQMYDPVAVQESMNGTTIIRQEKRLSKLAEPIPRRSKRSTKLHHIGLIGVLHLLWNEAKLNRWVDSPACDRRLGLVNAEVLKVANRVISQQQLLSSQMLVHAPIGSQQQQFNTSVIEQAIQQESKLLVLGALRKCPRTQFSKPFGKLPVTGNFGLSTIFVPEAVWAKTALRFAVELKLWERGLNVMALARIAPRKTGEFAIAQAREVVLMAVSDAWIPVENQSEIDQERAYRASGTSFIKPLRFDAPTAMTVPNFLVPSDDECQVVILKEQT